MKRPLLSLLLLTIAAWPPMPGRERAYAAEFDIDGPRFRVERLQFCEECGAALMVGGVPTGVLVRCPDCKHEQPRLADRFLLAKVYQLCRSCGEPLALGGATAGEVIECASCRTRQEISPRAIGPLPQSGLGYRPGFPPGSRKKSVQPAGASGGNPADNSMASAGIDVTLDPPEPAAGVPPLTTHFADGTDSETPESGDYGFAPAPLTAVPSPPAWHAEPWRDHGMADAPGLPDLDIAAAPAAPRADPFAGAGGVIDVPAISADMFGGPSRHSEKAVAGLAGPGEVVARVNGTPIYSGEVDRLAGPALEALRAGMLRESGGAPVAAQAEARAKELREGILNLLVDRELLLQEASRSGYRPDTAAVRALAADLPARPGETGAEREREASDRLAVNEMRRRMSERIAPISPGAVRDYYQRHRDEMLLPRRLAVASLVVFVDRSGAADPRDATAIGEEVAAALERGARFDELAARFDEFANRAGILPPKPSLSPEAQYGESVRAAAAGLGTGAVFGPVQTPGAVVFGKIVEARPPEPIPFADAEKDIRLTLERADSERLLDERLRELRKKADIKFYAPR